VGRLVPAEEDAGREGPEWELREREVEMRAKAEEFGARGELPLFLPMPTFMAPAEEV